MEKLTNQIYQICSNTILWTIIGAFLGAILGVIFTLILNRRNSRILLRLWSSEKCLADGITINPDIILSVINDSKISIPLLNVHIMDSSGVNVKLERIDNDFFELKPNQISQFKLKVLQNDTLLTEGAKEILTAKPHNFAVKIFIDKSNTEPVYIDKQLAMDIFHSISELVGRDYRKKTLIENLQFEERRKIIEQLNEMQNQK